MTSGGAVDLGSGLIHPPVALSADQSEEPVQEDETVTFSQTKAARVGTEAGSATDGGCFIAEECGSILAMSTREQSATPG